MRRIVADTGPIFHLYEASLELLLPQAGEIVFPPAVAAELSTLSPLLGGRSTATRQPKDRALLEFIEQATVPLPPAAQKEAHGWLESGLLHRGEAEALALARHLQADWFLTDDAAARLLSSQLGQEVHGSLGVVLWAAATGRMDLATSKQALGRLSRTSLWVSRRVLSEATALLDELAS